jgi:hypothetical protein
VPGIRFRTDAEPETKAEGRLRDIQSELSGGTVELGEAPIVAHLNFYMVARVDAPDKTYVSLWLPAEQRTQAVELLEAAEFTFAEP